MASRFAVCKDKEQALAMFDAGLLWLNWGGGDTGYTEIAEERYRWIAERYVNDTWVAEDFTYLTEEDL